MSELITICEQAARAGGEVLLDWQDRFQVREKAPADLVTEADLASQEAIREILLTAFPDHGFLGEEDSCQDEKTQQPATSPRYRWIVDPLDGTTNYVHKMPAFSVSIALEENGKILVATVYDPISQECYTAEAGQGAFLNGQRLQTSSIVSMDQALVAASFSAKVSPESLEIARFIEVLQASQALRRLGSAALNLGYLAVGRLDAYWATSVKVWDIAAGILLVQEAGGIVSGLDGGPLDLAQPRFAAAASKPLHEELIAILARAEP